MAGVIACDTCGEREGDLMIGNMRNGDQRAVCMPCAPVTLHAYADAIQQTFEVLSDDDAEAGALEADASEGDTEPDAPNPHPEAPEDTAEGADNQGATPETGQLAEHAG